MLSFHLLLSFLSIASAGLIITVSEYPQYCRMPSSSKVDVATPSSSTVHGFISSSSRSSVETSVPSAVPTGAVLQTPPGSAAPPNLGAVAGGSAADTVSQLFWVNYAEAIRQAAGIEIGANNAFFLGTQAQKGPLAGSYIPDEYTNQGLYQIANNLMNTSTMFYTPDYSHGYIQALSK